MTDRLDASTKQAQKNTGIDLLRIVSMLMICCLHVLGIGGILDADTSPSGTLVKEFLCIACFGAVNCYALISGYVRYGKKARFSSIVNLWFQVVFYLTLINVICYFAFPGSVGLSQIVTSFIPVSSQKYWYFTAYFCLFCFMPFLNKAVEALDDRQSAALFLTVLAILSVFPVIFGGYAFGGDIFKTSFGYSALWLAALYLTGAFFKKTGFGSRVKNPVLLLLYFLCVIVNFACRILAKSAAGAPLFDRVSFVLTPFWDLQYTAPLVVCGSICLFLFFSKLKCRVSTGKIVAFFAPATFGVYIIHLHPTVKKLLTDRAVFCTEYNVILFLLFILGVTLAVWLVCSLADKLRYRLFLLIRIDKLSLCIDKAATKIANAIIGKVCQDTEPPCE